MSKEVKLSKKNKMFAAAGIAAVLVCGIIAYYIYTDKQADKEKNKVNVSYNEIEIERKDDISESDSAERVQSTVEIQLTDCAIAVGNSIKVTAIVTPADTEQALVWSSSSTEVFEVSADGILMIRGTGTAVLTATVGNVSDAVIIEGINKVADGSVNNLPVYIVASGSGSNGSNAGNSSNSGGSNNSNAGNSSNSGGNNNSNAGNSSNSGGSNNSNAGNSSNSGGSNNSNAGNSSNSGGSNNSNAGNSSNSGGSNNSNAGNSSNSGGSNNSNAGNNSNSGGNNNSNAGNNSSSGIDSNSPGNNSGNENNSGSDSSQIGEQLPDIGFSQEMSNVYVCYEDGVYQGEIITQPNVTIMYIKKRSESFDARIKSVLEKLLPDESGQVWNNYITAVSDRTFTVEGRMVRIVVAANGGHSQIVIYN